VPDTGLLNVAADILGDDKQRDVLPDWQVMRAWATKTPKSEQWHARMQRLRHHAWLGLRRNINIVYAVATELFFRRVLVHTRLSELLKHLR